MIQRADTPDSPAIDASARIAQAIHPWRIVLFGSRARGTATADSDYDLYVEVDADEDALRDIQRRALALLDRKVCFDVKVVSRGTLERRRDDPGTIEWDVAREGRLLYADPSAPSSLPSVARVRERPRKTPESVAEWIESGDRDVRHAEHLWESDHGFWPEICWLSHRMCEKYLKALLVARYVRPARTHKLDVLLNALPEGPESRRGRRAEGICRGPENCHGRSRGAIASRTGLGLFALDTSRAAWYPHAAVSLLGAVLADLKKTHCS